MMAYYEDLPQFKPKGNVGIVRTAILDFRDSAI